MTITVFGKTIKTDNEGYLLNPQDWTKELRLEMVKQHRADGHKKVTETGWMIAKMAGIPKTAIAEEVNGG